MTIQAQGLRWMAALWRALPEPTSRRMRRWHAELGESLFVLVPLFLRVASHRAWTNEQIRLFDEFDMLLHYLERAREKQVLTPRRAAKLSAQCEALRRTVLRLPLTHR